MRIPFAFAALVLLPLSHADHGQPALQLTAAQVIARIQQAIPPKPPADTVDTIRPVTPPQSSPAL